jgi:hypothetical protein
VGNLVGLVSVATRPEKQLAHQALICIDLKRTAGTIEGSYFVAFFCAAHLLR